PAVMVVGLGDTAVLEARDRLRAAFGNAGFEWPDRRVTISLPPADLPKQGSGFDPSEVKEDHVKMRAGRTHILGSWPCRRPGSPPSTSASPRTVTGPRSRSRTRSRIAARWLNGSTLSGVTSTTHTDVR